MTADAGLGLDVSVFARVGDTLERVAGMMQDREDRRRHLFQQMHQVPITAPDIPLTGGAGALQMADTLSPKAGFMWSVRRLACSGFTVGTVQVYKNGFVTGTAPGVATGGELVAPFASAGVLTFGRGELLLDQNDQLIFSAATITGTIQIGGAADCFERWLLPDYLGLG
jgi:hypothetical protein